jgi:hypothetical protein
MITFKYSELESKCLYKRDLMIWLLAYKCRVYIKKKDYIPSVPPGQYKTLVRTKLHPGDSYIINPKRLLENETNASINQVYEYIVLASCRNLFDYQVRGIYTLPGIFAGFLKINPEHNRLLTVKDDQVHFIYETDKTEERKDGTKIW